MTAKKEIFPTSIMKLLKEVANRTPAAGMGVWEDYETGLPMQDDADDAIDFIEAALRRKNENSN